MQREGEDNITKGFVTGSGRRFVSDAPKEFHYTSFETKKLLNAYAPEHDQPLLYKKASYVVLEPHATLSKEKIHLEFNITSGTAGHSYVLKDIMDLLRAIDEKSTVRYGKHLEFTHDMSSFSPESQRVIVFLRDYFREKQQKDTYSYAYAKGHSKSIELMGHEIDEFFKATDKIYFRNNDFRARYTEERLLEIVPVFPPIDLHIEDKETGVTFESSSFTMFEGYSYIYFERKRKLHMIGRRDCEEVVPFLKFLSARRTENELFIAKKDLQLFSTGLYPVLDEYFNVSRDGYDPARYSPDIPNFEIYLDMPNKEIITCDIKAVYDKNGVSEAFHIFRPAPVGAEIEDESDIKRNHYLERKTGKAVSSLFDRMDENKGVLVLSGEDDSEDRIYEFIETEIKKLGNYGEVFISDAIRNTRIIRSPRVELGVSVVSDLLQLSLVPQDISPKELDKILTRYDRKKKYYRMKNGDVINLRSSEMEVLFSLKDGLSLDSEEILSGNAAVPKYRALFINDIFDKSSTEPGFKAGKSREFKKLVSSYAGMEDQLYDVPESLSEVLRDYQKTGFMWLRTLKHNGFGGILADDMGLGKTIQVLALLLSIKEEAEKKGEKYRCSLIVCPASLVYNWQHEISKFAPDLRSELAVGIKPDRVRVTSEIEEEKTDVIITSYDLLRRDIEFYKYISFECEIIDEAQFIKNQTTQVARAVKRINASFRVALTGTPIENRLSELWSIFDYCMPGYLFNYKRFHDDYEAPAVTEGDEAVMERLKRMIAPFVLRRLKKDVLTDLPDKLEENIYAPMTREQNELYKAHLQHIKGMIGDKDDDDLKKNRIVILSELTRLRQICCDPGLIYEDYKGGSAKVEVLIELIQSAVQSGHKILLFSQFTSMLERLTGRLTREGISHFLLTGSTKKEDRIRMVDSFQEDETPVFCISLKAGGTGLNLTAADIVIHFDHWWNIAVENQATDRAHRIGQKNVVTVYRLIMQDTIEERIILLQNKKKELAEELLNSGTMNSPNLSKEELMKLLG